MSDMQFGNEARGGVSPGFVISPLGAAIVEAMPDRRRKQAVMRAFKNKAVCPASELFSAKEVEAFYRNRGKKIRAVDGLGTQGGCGTDIQRRSV
jgi:hypothetical protein